MPPTSKGPAAGRSLRRARARTRPVAASLLVAAALSLGPVSCSSSSDGAAPGPQVVVPSTTSPRVSGCQALDDAAAALASGSGTGPDALRRLPAAVARLSDVVPDGLRGDVATIAEAVQGYVTVLDAHDFDRAAVEADPAATRALRALRTEEFSEALGRVRGWLGSACR